MKKAKQKEFVMLDTLTEKEKDAQFEDFKKGKRVTLEEIFAKPAKKKSAIAGKK